MKQFLILLLDFGFLPGCTGYNSYPGMPVGGYGYPPPVHYGYGYSGHTYRPPISNDQKALNYLYDHRNEIKRLPPQQQQQILRQAQKLKPQGNPGRHHRN